MARKKIPTMEEILTEAGLLPGMIEYSTKKGLEQGLKEGLEQGLETAARNALAQGASLDFVQKITGLDIQTITSLQNSN